MADKLDEPPEEPRGRLESLVPDIVRRAVVAGVGAVFMTEEGLRGMVGDLKLPKDALGYLRDQADKTRAEMARVAARELQRFFESESLRKEALKLLAGMTIDVHTTIRMTPDGQPQVQVRPRVNLAPRTPAAPPHRMADHKKP